MKFEPASSRAAYRETRLVRGSSVLAGKVGGVVSMSLLLKKKDRTTSDNSNKEKKSPGVNSNIKQGSTKDSYLFCFFPRPPNEMNLLSGVAVFRRGRRKNNNVNNTCIFSSITSQLRMSSPDTPAKDNPHRFYAKLQLIFWAIAG